MTRRVPYGGGTEDDPLLTPGEVGKVFRVDAKTIGRWAGAGRLPFTRTDGGHRRYKTSDVKKLIDELKAQEEL